MSEDKDQFERWIDQGVQRYVAAEPPLGMEARVLAELEQRQARRVWWRPWMIPVPAAAVVLAIAIGLALQSKPRPQPAVPQVSTATPAGPARPAPPPQVISRVPQHQRPASARVMSSAPRPEKFPAPSAPSEQEMLLARLAGNSVAVRTVATSAAKTSEAIEISRVQIDPVEIPLLPGPNQGE